MIRILLRSLPRLLGPPYIIAINLRLNTGTELPAVWPVANMALIQNRTCDSARLTCSQMNVRTDTPSHTNELAKRNAAKLSATTDGKLQPFRHPTVDVRQQLDDVSSELLVTLSSWTLGEHAAT